MTSSSSWKPSSQVSAGPKSLEQVTLTEAVNRGAVMKVLLKPWEDEVLRRHVQEAFEFQLRQLNE
ncbi:hypothetical protein [Parazoarcus communis]|uniref:hypothetical protein n=1 Tax=Parazoarcus communis TaxID=41977 RepID=UPI00131EFFC0|nr:hypothetical protein [Parazoarcus communis]